MKFGGTFSSNWANAAGSNNNDIKKEVILDEVARLIELDRPSVVSALNESGYKVSTKTSKKEIIDKTVSALYRSKQFKQDISKAIVANDYSNLVGSAVVDSVAQAMGAIFTFGAARQNRKAEEEKTRQQMYDKLLSDKDQKNWMPVIIIGGVLLIGGLVAFFALRNKK